MRSLIASILVVLCISSALGQTDEELLRKRLFENYDKQALPPIKPTLTMGLTVLDYDMDQDRSTMDLHFWLKMYWTDTRLTWNSDSEGIETLNYNSDTVWIPDIMLYNDADLSTFGNYAKTKVVGRSNGSMIWVPPGSGKGYCYMNMRYWPVDSHKCTFKFGSWVYSATDIDFKVMDDIIFEDLGLDYEKSRQFKLESHSLTRISKIYDCCPDEYVTMVATLEVQREAGIFKAVVQGPLVALCILTVIVFILPPASGEKICLGGFALVLNLYFLFNIGRHLSHSADEVPLVVELTSIQFYITVASVGLSALISRLVRVSRKKALPNVFENLSMSLAPALLLKGYKDQVTASKPASVKTNKEEQVELSKEDYLGEDDGRHQKAAWMLFGAFIDRICLVVFLAIFIILIASYGKVL